MINRTTIKLPTYSCILTFVVADHLERFVKSLYKKYNIADSIEDTLEGIVLTPDMNTYYLVISSEYLSHNTIAHEVYHAVVRVTEDRGVVDEEAQAWLAGHIAGSVYKFLERKKLKVKHG